MVIVVGILIRKKYYKGLRANQNLKSFDALLKVYSDNDFQSILDLLARRIDFGQLRTNQLSEKTGAHTGFKIVSSLSNPPLERLTLKRNIILSIAPLSA